MALVKQLVSSKKQTWRTPGEILHPVRVMFHSAIDIDPCASSNPDHHFAITNLTKGDDGLSRDWHGDVFMNPPFGRGIDKWIRHAVCQSALGNARIIGLTPANTGTRWGQLVLNTAQAVCFLKGRIKFLGDDGKPGDPAPFNAMMPLWSRADGDAGLFEHAFEEYGKVIIL